jgi:hypothetical protein
MNPEIFSILSKALDRAARSDKHIKNRGNSSVSDKKIIENLCQSSEYRKYVEDNLINEVALFMNNDKDFVYAEIAKLNTLNIKELRKLWKEKTGYESSPYAKKRTLIDKLAYVIQEAAFGGLSPKASKLLETYKDRYKRGGRFLGKSKGFELIPGMILTREYDGCKHSVRILESEKVEYDGEIYNSLSAVARAITGTRWNGREFFHVKKIVKSEENL